MRDEFQALEALLESNGLPMKTGTLDKVRKQLAGVSLWSTFGGKLYAKICNKWR